MIHPLAKEHDENTISAKLKITQLTYLTKYVHTMLTIFNSLLITLTTISTRFKIITEIL